MVYKQLKKANPSVPGKSGLCLVYARNVFSVAAKYPWAWTAWLSAKYKHKTTDMPNVAVPVWFSYRVLQGHVVVWVPKKGFYSVTKQGVKCFDTIKEVESYIGCKFVGWTEDINGVRVAEPAPAVTTYKVVKSIKGYLTSEDAKNKKSPRTTVKAGTYQVFNKANGMVNVTTKASEPGSWINPGDNKK